MEEGNIRELRSSRSRSTTPFIRASRDRESTHDTEPAKLVVSTTQTKGSRLKDSNRQKSGLTSVTESHTTEAHVVTTVKHVDGKASNDSDSSTERAAEENQKIGWRLDRQRARRRLLINGATPRKGDEVLAMAAKLVEEEKLQRSDRQKTSHYSVEEGQGIAYQIYKKAGDWWNKFPKTDYTYSRVSPHRKELAPGVIAMPNMSRRSLSTVRQQSRSENEIPVGTGLTVSKHDVTKSRWFDQTTSGSWASRKVLEDWAAVDSDVDDVAEALNNKTSKHVSRSQTLITVITSYFIAVWTFITVSYTHTIDAAYRLVGRQHETHFYATPRLGVSPVWIEGRFSWLRKLFMWVHRLVSSVMQLDTLLLSSWHTARKEQEHGSYEEDDFMEVDVSCTSLPSQNHNTWRLLLLLLPLIFLAGFHVVQTYSFPYPDLISEIKSAFSDANLFSFFESLA